MVLTSSLSTPWTHRHTDFNLGDVHELPAFNEAFNALYQIVVFLSHVVFEDFGTVDRVVNKNREICESNQTMKYAQHCKNLEKDMKKSNRMVKVLDMPVEDSITNGKIENMNTARDNVKKLLRTN